MKVKSTAGNKWEVERHRDHIGIEVKTWDPDELFVIFGEEGYGSPAYWADVEQILDSYKDEGVVIGFEGRMGGCLALQHRHVRDSVTGWPIMEGGDLMEDVVDEEMEKVLVREFRLLADCADEIQATLNKYVAEYQGAAL